MSKQYKIRWREADLKELERVVRNFNAKVRRIEKKNPENAKYLPKFSKTVFDDELGQNVIEFTDRLSVNQLKEMIKTRKDFNREINALKRFSRRGAEEIITLDNTDNNIKTTKWQKIEMSRRAAVINRLRKQRRDMIENIEVKGGTGYKVGDIGMGNQASHELAPLKITFPSMTQTDLKWKFKNVVDQSMSDYFNERDEMLMDNYINSIFQNYNYEDVKDVIDKISSMSLIEFLNVFYENPGIFEWSYHDEEQYHAYVNQIKEIWGV